MIHPLWGMWVLCIRFLYILLLLSITVTLSGDTYFDRGLEAFTGGDYEQSALLFERALAAGEDHEWVYLNLAASFRNMKHFEKGIVYAGTGLKLYPENIYLKDELFYGYFQAAWDIFSRDLDQAEVWAREAFNLKKEDGGSYNLLGTILANRQNPDKITAGVELLLEGFAKYPGDNYLGLNLYDKLDEYIAVLLTRKKYGNIVSFIKGYYILFQKHISYYENQGISLIDLDRTIDTLFKYTISENPGLCETIIKPLLEEYPWNFYLKHTLAVCFAEAGDKEQSFKTATEAYEAYLARFGPEKRDISMEVPLKGRARIALGFNSRSGHTHYGLWRYNVDFVLFDSRDQQVRPGGTFDNPEDHVIFDAPVYAPMSGIVEDVDNSNPDDSYVIIRPDGYEDLHLNIVHFKDGTIVVGKGSRVETGDYLGKIGRAVHLHIGIFNKYGVFVPYTFKNVISQDGTPVHYYSPVEGELIIGR